MYVYHYTLMQSFLQKSMCLKPSTNTHHRSFINKKEVIRKYSFSVKTIKCGREILILHSRFTASISSDTKHGPSSRMSIEIIVIFLFSPATQNIDSSCFRLPRRNTSKCITSIVIDHIPAVYSTFLPFSAASQHPDHLAATVQPVFRPRC